jgi:hypothetical protein
LQTRLAGLVSLVAGVNPRPLVAGVSACRAHEGGILEGSILGHLISTRIPVLPYRSCPTRPLCKRCPRKHNAAAGKCFHATREIASRSKGFPRSPSVEGEEGGMRRNGLHPAALVWRPAVIPPSPLVLVGRDSAQAVFRLRRFLLRIAP